MDVQVIVVLRGLKLEGRRKEKEEVVLVSHIYFFHLLEWNNYYLTVALQLKIWVSNDVGHSLEHPTCQMRDHPWAVTSLNLKFEE